MKRFFKIHRLAPSIVEGDATCAVIFAALFGFVALGAVEYVKTIREAHASLSDEAIVADIAWELGEDGRRKVNAAANEVEGAWAEFEGEE